MKRKSVYSYYAFGYNYRNLRLSNEGLTYKQASNRIKELFDYCDDLDLKVTKMAATDLRNLKEEIDQSDPTKVIPDSLADKIITAVDAIDTTLDAELKLVSAYILNPKRFALKDLLESPENLFGDSVFENLRSDVRIDVKLGLKCLAFHRSTASAFHILRATEGAIRDLYFCHIKRNRIAKPMWFGMVDALRKKNKPKPSDELLDHLDVIRKNYRNPTQHPDKFYSMDEAQDLMSNCISALNMISACIKKKA
jgi:hypothetical protein